MLDRSLSEHQTSDVSKGRARRPGYRCEDCGLEVARWVGRCPECQAWGTVLEVGAKPGLTVVAGPVSAPARPIAEVPAQGQPGQPDPAPGDFDCLLGRVISPALAARYLTWHRFQCGPRRHAGVGRVRKTACMRRSQAIARAGRAGPGDRGRPNLLMSAQGKERYEAGDQGQGQRNRKDTCFQRNPPPALRQPRNTASGVRSSISDTSLLPPDRPCSRVAIKCCGSSGYSLLIVQKRLAQSSC